MGSRGDGKDVHDPESFTNIVHSPAKDSQSNAYCERGVRTFEELLRTHKLALEKKLQEEVHVYTPAGAWLVEHVADL